MVTISLNTHARAMNCYLVIFFLMEIVGWGDCPQKLPGIWDKRASAISRKYKNSLLKCCVERKIFPWY